MVRHRLLGFDGLAKEKKRDQGDDLFVYIKSHRKTEKCLDNIVTKLFWSLSICQLVSNESAPPGSVMQAYRKRRPCDFQAVPAKASEQFNKRSTIS